MQHQNNRCYDDYDQLGQNDFQPMFIEGWLS